MNIVRRFVVLFLVLGTSLCAAEGGSRERVFLQGLEAFDHAKNDDDYRRAAGIFESLLQDGYQNGAVYYNLGNAWMKAGEYGRAISAYRKAQPLRPRDQYLQANLNQALASAPGRMTARLEEWWQRLFFWKDWFSLPEKSIGTSSLAVLAFLLAMLALKWPQPQVSVPMYRVVWLLVGLTFLIGLEATLANVWSGNAQHAVVIKETLARKGNRAEYQPAFDQPLKDGAEFTILERRGDWIFGHFEGVGDGWVALDAVVE